MSRIFLTIALLFSLVSVTLAGSWQRADNGYWLWVDSAGNHDGWYYEFVSNCSHGYKCRYCRKEARQVRPVAQLPSQYDSQGKFMSKLLDAIVKKGEWDANRKLLEQFAPLLGDDAAAGGNVTSYSRTTYRGYNLAPFGQTYSAQAAYPLATQKDQALRLYTRSLEQLTEQQRQGIAGSRDLAELELKVNAILAASPQPETTVETWKSETSVETTVEGGEAGAEGGYQPRSLGIKAKGADPLTEFLVLYGSHYYETACAACHGDKTAKGDINLAASSLETLSPESAASLREKIVKALDSGEMPKKGEKAKPSEKTAFLAWFDAKAGSKFTQPSP